MSGYTTRSDNGEIIFQPDQLVLAVADADQSVTNSATLVTVPAFTFPVGSRERYLLRYTVFFSTTASGDLKTRLDVPTSPTLFRQASWCQRGGDNTLTTPVVLTAEADQSFVHTGAEGILVINATLVNGATAGSVIFQFAQDSATSAESAVIRAGSYLEVRKF